MRTVKYKTLEGMVKQTLYGRITLNDMRCGRFYHRSKGWVNFKLHNFAQTEFYRGIAGVVWSKVTPIRVAYASQARYMGILDRLWYDGKRYVYCAGQDYVSEIRYIQNQLRRW